MVHLRVFDVRARMHAQRPEPKVLLNHEKKAPRTLLLKVLFVVTRTVTKSLRVKKSEFISCVLSVFV